MNKKGIFWIFSGIVLLLALIVAVHISTFVQPKIFFSAKISRISDEDYKRVLNNNQVMLSTKDKDIERFRHVDIQVKVVEPPGTNNHVKIERGSLHHCLENNDKIRMLGGGTFEHGNGKEYAENIEVYLMDSSEQDLRKMLENFRCKVTWKDLWKKENDKIFYLNDYLK